MVEFLIYSVLTCLNLFEIGQINCSNWFEHVFTDNQI